MRRQITTVTVLAILCVSTGAFAQDIRVTATVDRNNITMGNTIGLHLLIAGTQDVRAPEIHLTDALVQYRGPSTEFRLINGQMSSAITHLYVVFPQRTGALVIPPITVDVHGQSYTTEEITVHVRDAAARRTYSTAVPQAQQPQATDIASATDVLELQLVTDQTEAYVNQQIPVRLQLLVGPVTVRSCDKPIITAEGFLLGAMTAPTQSQVRIGNTTGTLLEFETTAVPVRTGTVSLGPASMTCHVIMEGQQRRRRTGALDDLLSDFFGGDPFADSFFASRQVFPMTVESAAVPLTIRALPTDGQIAGVPTAIGRFTVDVEAVPLQVEVGEPITLTMTVRGTGNFQTVKPPRMIDDGTQFKVYESQPRTTDTTQPLRQYEQVLIPLSASATEIPALVLQTFDPTTGAYASVTTPVIPITVRPSTQATQMLIRQTPTGTAHVAEETLGKDIVYIKEELGVMYPRHQRWYQQILWWVSCLSALLCLCINILCYQERIRHAENPSLRRASHALKYALHTCSTAYAAANQGDIAGGYAALFRALQQYVGDRCNIASDGLTKDELARVLRVHHAPASVVSAIEQLAETCDVARFASGVTDMSSCRQAIDHATVQLKALERWKVCT